MYANLEQRDRQRTSNQMDVAGASMNNNIGTYGYQNARGNLLNQISYSQQRREEQEEEEEPNDLEEDLMQEDIEEEEEDSEEDYEEEAIGRSRSEQQSETSEQGDEWAENENDQHSDNEIDREDAEGYLRENQDSSRLRARTAPLRPTEYIEQFKMSQSFTNLEQAAVCAVQIVQRNDKKFDLDSYEGQNSCKKFLGYIEKLCESMEIKAQNRTYRKTFSNAYKVLYKDGKLCYLTEILDSAQEAFPYLYVNGEKYVFSK